MNDTLKRKLRGPSKGNRRKKYLSYAEMQKVFDHLKNYCDPEDSGQTLRFHYAYAICQFLFVHGFRISEALSLRWTDIRRFEDELVAYFVGKGQVEAEQKIDEGSLEIVRQMNIWVRGREPKEDEYLFPLAPCQMFKRHSRKAERMRHADVWFLLKEVQDEVNRVGLLDWTLDNLSSHHFRHALGQYLSRERNLPVQAIAKVLRHKDVNLTASTYCEVEPISPKDYFD